MNFLWGKIRLKDVERYEIQFDRKKYSVHVFLPTKKSLKHTDTLVVPTLDFFFRLPKDQVSFVFMEDVFLGRQPNKIKWTVKTKTSDCKLLWSRRQKSLWIRVLLYYTIAVMVTTYPHSIVKLLFSRSNTFLLLHGNLLWNSLLIKWPVMTYVFHLSCDWEIAA